MAACASCIPVASGGSALEHSAERRRPEPIAATEDGSYLNFVDAQSVTSKEVAMAKPRIPDGTGTRIGSPLVAFDEPLPDSEQAAQRSGIESVQPIT